MRGFRFESHCGPEKKNYIPEKKRYRASFSSFSFIFKEFVKELGLLY